jgi:CheY-like chemotaxis protein
MTTLRKVLVVDDDPVVRKSFDRVLSSKGYAVITAENGEEALRKLNEEKYDVVYTDIRMPGMSGLEVAEEVKARRPWTPVVIITGYGTDVAEARAKAAGVSGFLHKPLSPDMIEDSARDALAGPTVVANAMAVLVGAEAPKAEAATTGSVLKNTGIVLKNIALFFAAPFIGLAYIVMLPFVGLGVLAVMAAHVAAKSEAMRAVGVALGHVGMVIAAPLIGLAYIVLFPIIGLAMLAWLGGRAAIGAGARRMR